MPGLVYTFRVALYTVTLLSVAFFAIFEAVVFNLIGQRLNTNYYVARTFYAVAGPIMGWQFEVEGEEHLWDLTDVGDETVEGDARKGGRSAVLLGNHQSFVDILYLGRIFPKQAAIMAKKSIKLIPGLGWWMMLSGTVFINRSNNRSAIATMHHAGEEVKRKRISLWIFPEGTRHLSPADDLLPFKKGAFYLAVQSNVPIVPVVCQNYHHLFDGKTRFKSGKLKIKVLPPIPTTGMTTADVPELMEKTRDLMVQALREISQSRPSRAESPTPLLADRSGTSYESTRDDGEEASVAEQPAGAVESQNVEAAASARNADIAAAVEADGKRNTSRRRSRDTSRKLNVA